MKRSDENARWRRGAARCSRSAGSVRRASSWRRAFALGAACSFGVALMGVVSEAVSTVTPPPAVVATPVGEALASGAAPVLSTPPSAVPGNVANEESGTSGPAPSAAAWKTAPRVTPQRAVGERSAACDVRQLGRWYNVRCKGLATSAITQLGGDDAGVHFKLDPAGDDGLPREGELTFSLREGQSRVFSFWTLGDGYDGPLTVIAAVVVQARRHAGVTDVLLHDALNQPIRTAQSELRARQQTAPQQPAKGNTTPP